MREDYQKNVHRYAILKLIELAELLKERIGVHPQLQVNHDTMILIKIKRNNWKSLYEGHLVRIYQIATIRS